MEERDHRLSSIDLLPEAANADIIWAIAELDAGRRSDTDILFEFNDRLKVIGEGPVSRSAFGRYALRKRKIFGGQKEFREVARVFAQEYGARDIDSLTLTLSQMLMTAMYEQLVTRKAGSKEVMEMARALASLNSAKRVSAGEKVKADKAETDAKAVFDKAFNAAETAMESSGHADGKAYLKRIRQEVYNIFDDEDAPKDGPKDAAA